MRVTLPWSVVWGIKENSYLHLVYTINKSQAITQMYFQAILLTVAVTLTSTANAEPIDIEARKPEALEARHTIGNWHPPRNTLEARNTLDVLEARHMIGSTHPPGILEARNTLEASHTIGSWHDAEHTLEARHTL